MRNRWSNNLGGKKHGLDTFFFLKKKKKQDHTHTKKKKKTYFNNEIVDCQKKRKKRESNMEGSRICQVIDQMLLWIGIFFSVNVMGLNLIYY